MRNACRKSRPDEFDVLANRILVLLTRNTQDLRVLNDVVRGGRLCLAVERLRDRVFLFTVEHFECSYFSGKRIKINRWRRGAQLIGETAIKPAQSVRIRCLDCLTVFQWVLELGRLQICMTDWDDRLGTRQCRSDLDIYPAPFNGVLAAQDCIDVGTLERVDDSI